jgi:hypothetical protein
MRALLCLCLAACASTPVRVRGIDGRALPTSARLDADVAPIQITCGSTRYLIVAAPRPYLAGTHFGTVRPYVHDGREFCRTVER